MINAIFIFVVAICLMGLGVPALLFGVALLAICAVIWAAWGIINKKPHTDIRIIILCGAVWSGMYFNDHILRHDEAYHSTPVSYVSSNLSSSNVDSFDKKMEYLRDHPDMTDTAGDESNDINITPSSNETPEAINHQVIHGHDSGPLFNDDSSERHEEEFYRIRIEDEQREINQKIENIHQ